MGNDYLNLEPRILVVDDEKNIRDMLKRHFRFMGYEVEDASDGKEALAIMQQQHIDVVISDINMPVMNGIDFLRETRKNFPMSHFIMITGYVTLENILCCMRLGADTCIFKPLEDMRELENAVKNAIDHQKHWQAKLKTLISLKPQ